MASYAKFDVWQNTAGITQPATLQVVKSILGNNLGTTSNDSTQDNPSWAISTTTTTWTDTSNLQLTITPKFANSIIKLELCMYMGNGASGRAPAIRIIRGSTIVWRPNNNSTGPFSLGYAGQSDRHDQIFIMCIDSPNTTSAVTYSLQYRTYNGTNASTFFSYPAASHYGTLNTFVATEIAQ